MRRTRALQALGAGVVALALAGCMKVDMSLDVKSDDTVDGTMIVGIEKSMADMMGGADSMVEDMLGDTTGLPEGATTEDWEDDEYVGVKATFEDAALDEFSGDDETFSIVHDGEEFVLTGTMDLSSATGDLGDLGADAGSDLGDLGSSMEGMADSFDIRIAVTFPGEVIESNGEVDGTTVTWVPSADGPQEMTARAKDSGGAGGMPVWAWILIGVVVIAAVVGLLFFLSRNKNPQADPQADAFGAGAVPPPAGADTAAGAAAAGVVATEAATTTLPEDAAPQASETTELPAPDATPAGPDVPEVPDAPAAPEVPDAPEASDVPDAPVAPEAPVVPEPPVAPEPPTSETPAPGTQAPEAQAPESPAEGGEENPPR